MQVPNRLQAAFLFFKDMTLLVACASAAVVVSFLVFVGYVVALLLVYNTFGLEQPHLRTVIVAVGLVVAVLYAGYTCIMITTTCT